MTTTCTTTAIATHSRSQSPPCHFLGCRSLILAPNLHRPCSLLYTPAPITTTTTLYWRARHRHGLVYSTPLSPLLSPLPLANLLSSFSSSLTTIATAIATAIAPVPFSQTLVAIAPRHFRNLLPRHLVVDPHLHGPFLGLNPNPVPYPLVVASVSLFSTTIATPTCPTSLLLLPLHYG